MSEITCEQAYAAGFCKAAAEAGVDPVALYKKAGIFGLMGKGIGLGLRGAKRYSGLVLGGKVGKYDKLMKHTGQRLQQAADSMYGAGQAGDMVQLTRSSRMMDRLLPLQKRLASVRAGEARKVMAARVAGVGALGAGALGYAPAKDYFGGNPFGRGGTPEEYDHEKTYYGSLTE